MFRNLRRKLRRARALRKLEPRLAALRDELRKHFGEELTFEAAGARGRDSIFMVHASERTLAVLRVVNPFLTRKPLAEGLPYTVGNGKARLDREWLCYTLAAPAGLCPAPLWRSDDALACAYVEGHRLSDALSTDMSRYWALNTRAANGLCALHERQVVHMDASLANTLEHGEQLTFIDFEYEPASNLSFEQACCYDHLRLIESGIKFIPDEILLDCSRWLQFIRSEVPQKIRSVNIEPLAPALERTLRHPALSARLLEAFPGIRDLG